MTATSAKVEEMIAISGYTPGPWAWFGNARMHSIYLATPDRGRQYVMSFKRWGMSGAEPVFQPRQGKGMVPASGLVTFEVGDRGIVGVDAAKADGSVYRLDIRGIDCADARLIEAAPAMHAALIALNAENERLRARLEQLGDMDFSAATPTTEPPQ